MCARPFAPTSLHHKGPGSHLRRPTTRSSQREFPKCCAIIQVSQKETGSNYPLSHGAPYSAGTWAAWEIMAHKVGRIRKARVKAATVGERDHPGKLVPPRNLARVPPAVANHADGGRRRSTVDRFSARAYNVVVKNDIALRWGSLERAERMALVVDPRT